MHTCTCTCVLSVLCVDGHFAMVFHSHWVSKSAIEPYDKGFAKRFHNRSKSKVFLVSVHVGDCNTHPVHIVAHTTDPQLLTLVLYMLQYIHSHVHPLTLLAVCTPVMRCVLYVRTGGTAGG